MLLSGKTPMNITVLACALILAMALVLEHGMGVQSCSLCKYERMVFMVGGMVSLVFIILPGHLKSVGTRLAGVIFFGGFGLATYHVLIQQGVFPLPPFCAPASLPAELSIEQVRQHLLNTPFVPCNKVTWSLFGLSLAAYSAVGAGILSLYNLLAARRP